MRYWLFLPCLLILLSATGCSNIEFNNFSPDDRKFIPDPQFGTFMRLPERKVFPGEDIFRMVNVVHIEVVGHTAVGVYWNQEAETHQLSGVVVNYGGKPHVLTAGHACPKDFRVKNIFVYFQNSKKPPEEAELVIRDLSAHMDFALLKFKRSDFVYKGPFPPIGSSSKLKHGEKIYVLGSPLGIPFSISQGVVMNRAFSKYIFYDALGNPGNSGGPMVNQYGEVVGITVKGLRMGGFFNPFITTMPVALPIDDVVTVLRRVKTAGNVKHPRLDFGVIDSAELNILDFKKHGLKRPAKEGIMVLSPGSGLKTGDIICACDETDMIDDWQFIKKIILEHDAGDKVPIKIHRDGKEMVVTVRLRPSE